MTVSGEAARRGDAERDDRRRFYQFALMVEPDFAALDLVIVRTLVQPALAAHLVLEMLDRVGDEGFVARDAGVLQRGVEQPASRADERFARKVFLVAGCSPTSMTAAWRGPSPGTAWVASR
jgi:hypothetical protein